MGDRVNTVLRFQGDSKTDLYIYGHWSGHSMPATLARGIYYAKGRWDDESYCARIIVSSLLERVSYKDALGYGIAPYMPDNEHSLMICDLEKNELCIGDERFSFGEVAELHEREPESLYECSPDGMAVALKSRRASK